MHRQLDEADVFPGTDGRFQVPKGNVVVEASEVEVRVYLAAGYIDQCTAGFPFLLRISDGNITAMGSAHKRSCADFAPSISSIVIIRTGSRGYDSVSIQERTTTVMFAARDQADHVWVLSDLGLDATDNALVIDGFRRRRGEGLWGRGGKGWQCQSGDESKNRFHLQEKASAKVSIRCDVMVGNFDDSGLGHYIEHC